MTAVGYFNGNAIVSDIPLKKNQQVFIISIDNESTDIGAGSLHKYAGNGANSDFKPEDAALERYDRAG